MPTAETQTQAGVGGDEKGDDTKTASREQAWSRSSVQPAVAAVDTHLEGPRTWGEREEQGMCNIRGRVRTSPVVLMIGVGLRLAVSFCGRHWKRVQVVGVTVIIILEFP